MHKINTVYKTRPPFKLSVNEFSSKHVTHRGGRGEPFHDWYSYLEGFSPEFVKHLLSSYFPKAAKIVDPFAGTGTTPIVLSSLGIECGFCEVNPMMRLVIDAKLTVGRLCHNERTSVAHKLRELSNNLGQLVGESTPNSALQLAYIKNFGDSRFFDDEAYVNILRLRSLNDVISAEDPLLGDLLSIAVMSRLVRCSRLKRSGDVRYKTEKELAKGIPPILTETAKQLLLVADDCESAPDLLGLATLVTNNAKDLGECAGYGADGVITSPPYLNGTNYFRNTKLELWFGKFLLNGTTLRTFRDMAITSGINDVGAVQGRNHVSASVAETVKSLGSSYDERIPRMVAGYFEDMQKVLMGLAKACRPGATLCIDIGDSRYGGVHVPTHDILADLAKGLGMEHIETLTLRARLSKDKSRLAQSLVVLKTP